MVLCFIYVFIMFCANSAAHRLVPHCIQGDAAGCSGERPPGGPETHVRHGKHVPLSLHWLPRAGRVNANSSASDIHHGAVAGEQPCSQRWTSVGRSRSSVLIEHIQQQHQHLKFGRNKAIKDILTHKSRPSEKKRNYWMSNPPFLKSQGEGSGPSAVIWICQ